MTISDACDVGHVVPCTHTHTHTRNHSGRKGAYPAAALLVVRGAVEGGGGGIIVVVGEEEGVGVGSGQGCGLAAMARGPGCGGVGVGLIGESDVCMSGWMSTESDRSGGRTGAKKSKRHGQHTQTHRERRSMSMPRVGRHTPRQTHTYTHTTGDDMITPPPASSPKPLRTGRGGRCPHRDKYNESRANVPGEPVDVDAVGRLEVPRDGRRAQVGAQGCRLC